MNNTLVTLFGGGGFVGRYVAQALLSAGARVRVAERQPRSAYFLKPLGGLGQTQFIAADITRRDSVERAVEGADWVVNLVGTFGPNLHAVHVEGAGNIAAAAAQAGAKALVHVSAIGADPQSESAYGRSKGLGEEAVRAAFPAATILRPSVVFGREDQFTNRFARMIETMPMVPVLRAEAKFQPVYVGDVADAVVAALQAPHAFGGRTLALGGPDVMSMVAIQRYLAHATGREKRFVELPDAAGALIARMGFLPGAPISSDQWQMLQSDNVVGAQEDGLAALGVAATPMASVAPDWLVVYRKGGRFGARPEPA